MARPMIPFVQGNSYYASRSWTPLVRGNGWATENGGDDGGVPKTVTGSLIHITDALAKPVNALSVRIDPAQSGTGDPSPDNVRPISGWTSAKVNRTCVNIWDGVTESGYIDVNTGEERANPNQQRSLFISCKPSTNYAYVNTNAASGVRIAFYDGAKNYAGTFSNGNNNPQVFTTPANANYLRFYWGDTSGISINYPSNDREYHAYTGTVIPVSFGEAGTVYGGTLDVTTGVLTVTHQYIDLSTKTWTKVAVTSPYFYASVSDAPYKYISEQTNFLCSQYSKAPIGSSGSAEGIYLTDASQVRIRDLNYSSGTADAFKTAMSGVQLVYELATPVTYQLTPTEVTTLLGENNIWADTGDTTLTYMAMG